MKNNKIIKNIKIKFNIMFHYFLIEPLEKNKALLYFS